jgi:hypothetical protein
MTRQGQQEGMPRAIVAACALTALVVAIVVSGGIQPGTAQAADPLSWSAPTLIGPPESLSSVSCPSSLLCLVGYSSGNILFSTTPTGAASVWGQPISIDPYGRGGYGINGLSCVPGLCVVVDGNGDVVTSTDPTGGVGAWHPPEHVDGTSNGFGGVSCRSEGTPTTTLCVAVDDGTGDVVTSTNPTGGASAWITSIVDGKHPLNAVTCPSVSLCVATDGEGNIVASTDPSGGASHWTTTHVDGNKFGLYPVLACPSVSLCVASDGEGDVVSSTDPLGGASAWSKPVSADGNGDIDSLSCPSVNLCVGTDGTGNVVTSTDPTGGASEWTTTNVEGGESFQNALSGVSCPSAELCLVVDVDGRVIIGTPSLSDGSTSNQSNGASDGTTSGSGSARGGSSNKTSDSVGSAAAASVSTAQIAAALGQQLTPSGRLATIAGLLKGDDFAIRLKALEAGTALINWVETPGGARSATNARVKSILVASGRHTFPAAGTATVKLKLTAAGRGLLKHASRLILTARGTFTPIDKAPVSTTKVFVLKH